ncbi:TIGR04086 family membrane protein [Paenibacillus sp. y28]|uniref:TIGR04086 family membrane protein n=1 Tax=Paenibacillus sp. y28 TaxID=3129110 RepID=UPI0030191C02
MNPMTKVPKVKIGHPLLAALWYAMLWMCVSAVITSLMLAYAKMQEETLGDVVFVIHGLSSAIGGFVAARRHGKRGWYQGALLGMMYTVLIILIGFLGFDGSLSSRTLVLLAVCTCSGALGGMFGVNLNRNR